MTSIAAFDNAVKVTPVVQPYYRSAGTASLPGVGVGLAISHALVAQMGGTRDVESEVGAGAPFPRRLSSVTQVA